MCTVTIIPHNNGIRLAANRDESRQRPKALPPRVVEIGTRHAVMPIDPQSGGTWIAVNDAGLVMTLLNAYAKPYSSLAPPPKRSRGTIIPDLMTAGKLNDAIAKVQELPAQDFAAFRLVIADRTTCVDFHADGNACVRRSSHDLDRPVMFTSSGLGDALVDAPRRALFNEMAPADAASQDAFQRHSWPDRRHLSVCMSRPEARTVSLTIVELGLDGVAMIYYPEAPDEPSQLITSHLVLASVRPSGGRATNVAPNP